MLNNPEQLLSIFLRGAMGRRGRKRARRAVNFLTGRKGFLTASTLLAAAGVAWGVYESMQGGAGGAGGAGEAGGAGGAGEAGGVGGGVPPIPTSPTSPTKASPTKAPTSLAPDILRLVRLAVSAARADGVLSADERRLIVEQARQVGLEAIVEQEILQPRSLAEIVAGVTDAQHRADLYTLAFAIVRADESVSGAERVYLAQLAHRLGLDAPTVARLESDTAARIDATPDDDGPATEGPAPNP